MKELLYSIAIFRYNVWWSPRILAYVMLYRLFRAANSFCACALFFVFFELTPAAAMGILCYEYVPRKRGNLLFTLMGSLINVYSMASYTFEVSFMCF